ncbi:MAG: hypothetical protein N2C14_14495 [Planctomycetales bacterium]
MKLRLFVVTATSHALNNLATAEFKKRRVMFKEHHEEMHRALVKAFPLQEYFDLETSE